MKRTRVPKKRLTEHEKALAHFKKADPVLHKAARSVSSLLKSRRAEKRSELALFQALCESVVSQQLAVKAADSIWARVVLVCGGEVTPAAISKARLPRLRSAGLSGAKAKTLKELSRAMKNGLVLSVLRNASQQEAEAELTQIWGIGPWTTEMFLMFALNHPDIFSSRDLGLIRSMEDLYGIRKDSPRHVYEKIAERWAPHRTLASRVLWRVRDTKK
jgi:DNA-3-methyladenine glycosylase II